MLFSITIAAYNCEKYLDTCIESIFKQTENDYEIVIVNDCSTDNTGAKCEELAKKYPNKIRVFHHNVNKGLLLARRTTFEKALGEWIICVDADDFIVPETLSELKKVILKHKDCDMILYNLECKHADGNKTIFDLNLKENNIYSGENKKDVYYQILVNNNINSMCQKCFKKDVIDFDTDYSNWEPVRIGTDIFQSLPLFDNAKKIVYLNKVLYYYIKTEGSITTKFKKDMWTPYKFLYLRYEYFFNKWNYTNKELESFRLKWVITFISYINYYYRYYKKIKDISYFNAYVNNIISDNVFFELCQKTNINKLRFDYKFYIYAIKNKNIKLLKLLSYFTELKNNLITKVRK